MSNVQTGNLEQIAYTPEIQLGSTPSKPTGKILRWTGFTLNPEANYIENPEFRVDNMKTAGRRGSLRGKGTISGKMSFGTYDDFFAAFCGLFAWSNNNTAKIKGVSVSSAPTVAVDGAAKTYTRADAGGSFLKDGFAVGDYVQWSGFTNAGNNGTVTVSALTDAVMTCTSTTMVTEAAGPWRTCCTNCRPSFTLERAAKDTGAFMPYAGMAIDGFTLSAKVDDAVDISFDVLTKTVGTESSTTLFAATTPANSNPLMTSWDGVLKKGGQILGNVVSWTLKGARNSDVASVCGNNQVYDIQPKAATVTGTLEIYFDSIQSYTDFRSEADVALQLTLGPSGTQQSYTIDLTKCRYKNWKGEPKDGMETVTVDFESYAPDSGTNTSLMITRGVPSGDK